jgi:hypothetical protein
MSVIGVPPRDQRQDVGQDRQSKQDRGDHLSPFASVMAARAWPQMFSSKQKLF